MIEIDYKKNPNKDLFKSLEKFDIQNTQNYIPIYDNWFNLNLSNWNSINLNNNSRIIKIIKQISNNKFICVIEKQNKELVERQLFFKFSPLLDPTKYMVGKYTDIPYSSLFNLPRLHSIENNKPDVIDKIQDRNNSAYVDSFFSYLTSKTLHNHNFKHGLDFFGSFLALKKKYYFNIVDDIEFLYDSDFFHDNKGKLFQIDDMDSLDLSFTHTRKRKEKLVIDNNNIELKTHNLDVETLDSIFSVSNDVSNGKSELIFNYDVKTKSKRSMSKTSSTCSSRSSNTSSDSTDEECNSEYESGSDGSDESDGSEYSDSNSSTFSSTEFLGATINNFPVQVICLEELVETLDYFLESSKLSENEWVSCLFQVIIQLITYQKLFDLTHNDLHTNNIMYKTTDIEFLYYKFNDKYYKVPTYGKIYKIIDFGRAIYKFRGKLICSDSFHPKGDAATQYNCEPYLNSKKPRLEPNNSFDLCRLGCSLYDFFVDEDENENENDPLASLIMEWTRDDKGRNILYKNNGDERYPDFKLYKMITRTVHNHIPEHQLDKPIFKKYNVSRKKISKKAKVFNIDKLPSYVEYN